MIGPSQRPLSDNIQHSQETHIHAPRRDSNPQSQQASGCRPTSVFLWPTIGTLKQRCLGKKNLVQVSHGLLDPEGVGATIPRRIGNHLSNRHGVTSLRTGFSICSFDVSIPCPMLSFFQRLFSERIVHNKNKNEERRKLVVMVREKENWNLWSTALYNVTENLPFCYCVALVGNAKQTNLLVFGILDVDKKKN